MAPGIVWGVFSVDYLRRVFQLFEDDTPIPNIRQNTLTLPWLYDDHLEIWIILVNYCWYLMISTPVLKRKILFLKFASATLFASWPLGISTPRFGNPDLQFHAQICLKLYSRWILMNVTCNCIPNFIFCFRQHIFFVVSISHTLCTGSIKKLIRAHYLDHYNRPTLRLHIILSFPSFEVVIQNIYSLCNFI